MTCGNTFLTRRAVEHVYCPRAECIWKWTLERVPRNATNWKVDQGRGNERREAEDGGAGVLRPIARPTERTGPEDRPDRFNEPAEGGSPCSKSPRGDSPLPTLSFFFREKDQKDREDPPRITGPETTNHGRPVSGPERALMIKTPLTARPGCGIMGSDLGAREQPGKDRST